MSRNVTYCAGSLAVGFGIALAVAAGTGTATADTASSDTSVSSAGATTSADGSRGRARAKAPAASAIRSAAATAIPDSPGLDLTEGLPRAAAPVAKLRFAKFKPVAGLANSAASPTGSDIQPVAVAADPTVPSPTDETETPYGDLGKWMVTRTGQIATWLGQTYQDKTLLEPINVVIIDPTSTSVWQSRFKLNWVMFWSGFPGQVVHSTGYQGYLGGTKYGMEPTGTLQAFSDNLFVFSNNHGRVFGPYPGEDGGYVWIAAYSREKVTWDGLTPTHGYVSFETAEDAVRRALIRTGGTDLGHVALDNTYNTDTTTTGDSDGLAAVIKLR